MWKTAEVYMDAIMFSYFSPVNNNNVNVSNFSSIILLMYNSFFCKLFYAWNTRGYFLILLNSVSKMPLGGGGGGVKGPRADNMPRAPRNLNPALNCAPKILAVRCKLSRLANRIVDILRLKSVEKSYLQQYIHVNRAITLNPLRRASLGNLSWGQQTMFIVCYKNYLSNLLHCNVFTPIALLFVRIFKTFRCLESPLHPSK